MTSTSARIRFATNAVDAIVVTEANFVVATVSFS